MRSPFFPQTGAHDIHIWGIFCGNSGPCARRAVRFLDSLPAVCRHFSASAAPAPRCGYKIRPPVFYTASRLIRTLPCAVAAIVRQSAGGPPSPTRPCPRSCPAKSRQRLRRARTRRLYILFSYAGSPPNPPPPTLDPARGLPGAQGRHLRQCFRDPDTQLPRPLPGRLPMPRRPRSGQTESSA